MDETTVRAYRVDGEDVVRATDKRLFFIHSNDNITLDASTTSGSTNSSS